MLVQTITAYDPYNPPKIGASLQLFSSSGGGAVEAAGVDPRELVRQAAPVPGQPLPDPDAGGFRQAVGMFDAANGSVREDLFRYAAGRNDPAGPMGPKEYLVSIDRYSGYVYHTLIEQLMQSKRRR